MYSHLSSVDFCITTGKLFCSFPNCVHGFVCQLMAYKFVKTTKATTTVTKRSYFCRIQWFPFKVFVYKDPCVKGCSWFFHSLTFNPNAQQLFLFFCFFILVLINLTAFEGGPAMHFYFYDNVDSFMSIAQHHVFISSKRLFQASPQYLKFSFCMHQNV